MRAPGHNGFLGKAPSDHASPAEPHSRGGSLRWIKCAVIALPFLAVASDISSWYLVKLFHPFAAVVIFGGALMGASFAFMWVVTMYQLWFSRPPRAVLDRAWGDLPSLD